MFDYVDYECICPVCNKKVSGFQSKDGNCIMETIDTSKINNFYTVCRQCGCWIEFKRAKDNRFMRTVSGKNGEMPKHNKEIIVQ